MRDNRLVVAVAVVALLALSTPAAPAAQERQARQAAARELLEVMQMERIVIQGAITMLEAQIRAEPQMENFRDVLETFMRESLAWEIVGPQLVDLYAETYTEAELRDILTFYGTPAGRRLLETQSELMARAAAIGESAVAARQDVLQRRILERSAELQSGSRPF